MKKIKILFGLLVIILGTHTLFALEYHKVTGKVVGPYKNLPIAGAVVTSSESIQSVQSDSAGNYTIELPTLKGTIEVWAPGYHNNVKPVYGNRVNFVMIPESKINYSTEYAVPFGNKLIDEKTTAINNISKSDFSNGGLFINNVLNGVIPGLQVIDGSGMPGEGSYINARGLNSLIGKTSPLIIIDGVPYMPDMNESPVVNGFSNNMFNAFSAADIKNISYLKGSEAAIYGSLASNGVLIIQTDDARDLETKVSFVAQYGVANNKSTMPVLNVGDYRKYIGNVALTHFDDMGDILIEFPFLKDDPEYYYNFLYNNNTNWQDLIMNPAFVSENILKIKGGDAVAKYDLSFGYLNQQGVVENSGMKRYNMRLNSSINISQKLNFFTSMSLAYISNNLHEQGIVPQTNPLLASMSKSPMLSPYRKDEYNNLLPDYASVRNEEGHIRIGDAVSNPLALVNTTSITNEGSDVLMNGGINYLISNNLKITGIVGLYNNYNRTEVFVPGVSGGAIMPLENGLANNTVREGIRETFNMYYSVNGTYRKQFNTVHDVNIVAGWQTMTTRREFDAGEGRNTSSDFYKTLDNVGIIGQSFYGYINKRNWTNSYMRANYTFNKLYEAGFVVAIDGASSTGNNAAQFGVFPGINTAAYLHNLPLFADKAFINRLLIRSEYVMTGNSDFNSNLSDYYYQNQVFRELSGIVRANIPNSSLKWENNATLNLGIDFSGFNHRIDLTLDLYNKLTSDVILAKKISPAFGADFTYDNLASIQNAGVELGLQAYIINSKNFDFVIGGNLAGNKNKVKSLGGEKESIIEMDNGIALITREGESLYSFFGYQTDGVYASTPDALADGLSDYAGNPFGAGDIKFVNIDNTDNKINETDRVIIGDPNPAFFGNLFSSIRYKGISIFANFTFSYGNEAYNGLRRNFETMDGYGNQLVSTQRRWQAEGQVTDMPRPVYGDPIGNGRFSNRWIEDASFLKLKELTLSYTFQKGDIKFLQGGMVYVTGENLLTFTEYLGLDPEFSYSYLPYMQGLDLAKVPLMRTVKLGFKLQF